MKMRSPTRCPARRTFSPQAEFKVLASPRSRGPARQRLRILDIRSALLALVLLGEQLLDTSCVDVEQHRQRADIDDVLEQLALARVGVGALQIAVSGTPIT
jgi:hypothetical protein